MNRVYLDYNATAPVRPEAIAAVTEALENVGNPSSVHAAGREARARIELARRAVAELVGAKPAAVTFTSGGTEANALAIHSAVAGGIERIIVSAVEHDAVRAGAETSGAPVQVWPVDARGVADLDWLERALRDGPRTLVCLMSANNETGVIQPVAEASALVRSAGGWLHVDAVQSAGKRALDMTALGADTLALSAHKLGGPQGVGALVAGERATIHRRQHGGGQERGARAGTEAGPAIAGLGAAALACISDLHTLPTTGIPDAGGAERSRSSGTQSALSEMAKWRDHLAHQMSARGAIVLGDGADRLEQTLCVATPGYSAELQVMALDLAGVCISAGAACSSGKMKPSHVVAAMGRPDLAPFAIRISGGWASTEEDWLRCGEAWAEAHARRFARVKETA